MASNPTPADLIAAVNADDATLVAELVAADPSLANARDEAGVSALMLSKYRFARPVTDALIAADPERDIFEATALGEIERLRERLLDDPAAVARLLRRRVHRPPLRGVLRQARGGPRPAGARGRRRRVDAEPVRQPAAPCRGGGPPHRGLSRAGRGRRRRGRPPARRVHAAPRGRAARGHRAGRAAALRRRGPRDPRGRGPDGGRPGRRGRAPGRGRALREVAGSR